MSAPTATAGNIYAVRTLRCPHCDIGMQLNLLGATEAIRLRVDGNYSCNCAACKQPIVVHLRYQPIFTATKAVKG